MNDLGKISETNGDIVPRADPTERELMHFVQEARNLQKKLEVVLNIIAMGVVDHRLETPDLNSRWSPKGVPQLEFDGRQQSVIYNNVKLLFTVTEYKIMEYLGRHPKYLRTRDQIMDIAYGSNIAVDDRTIDSHIKRIRKKFYEIDPDFDLIVTRYGTGYQLIVD
jgi:DNA-binding response OmpR family regulator